MSAVGVRVRAVGTPMERIDGPAKVTGTAPYAFEHPLDHPAYLHPVQATIALGRVAGVDTTAAEALDGVLVVLTHLNAPRLASDEDRELWVLQSDVVAEKAEIARHAAVLVRIDYEQQPRDRDLPITVDKLLQS